MGLRITTNVSALNTHSALVRADRAVGRSLERLSSGLRINRAADDAAGLSISETTRTQVRGDQQAAKNIQDAINLLNVADGGTNEMLAIAQRMRELAVQASNGTLTAKDRQATQAEFSQLQAEISNISGYTTFNGISVFLGAAGAIVTSGPRTTAAASPASSVSVAGQNIAAVGALPLVGGNRVLTLSSPADQYGLGVPGPQSIVLTLRNTGSGATMTLPYGAGGFTYNGATSQVSVNNAAIPPGFNQVQADYIQQGSLTNIVLPSTPIAGSAQVNASGTPIAAGGANGFTIAGNLLTINGNGRPTAAPGMTINTGYTATGTTTLTLNTTNPFTGNGATSLNGLSFTVNGVPTAFTSPADYTLTQGQVAQVGNTPLYSYTVTLNNTSIAATGPGQTTVAANYTVSYPTITGPYVFIVQEGANYKDTETINLPPVTLGTLNIAADSLSTQASAMTAISDVDAAISQLAGIRSGYGARTNGLIHVLNAVTAGTNNQAAAESRIRDVDMALETTQLSRQQILVSSATSMLANANTSPQQVLRLLH